MDLPIMFIGKLILITMCMFIVASCIPIGDYKLNPTFTVLKQISKQGDNK
jgi:hypothetical protein